MKEGEPSKDTEMTIPPNMTIAWHTSDVSYTIATYKPWVEQNQRLGQERLIGIARDEGVLPEQVYKDLFDKTVEMARAHAKNSYHYVRLDNCKFVAEDENTEPYSEANGWQKTMHLFGYTIRSKM